MQSLHDYFGKSDFFANTLNPTFDFFKLIIFFLLTTCVLKSRIWHLKFQTSEIIFKIIKINSSALIFRFSQKIQKFIVDITTVVVNQLSVVYNRQRCLSFLFHCLFQLFCILCLPWRTVKYFTRIQATVRT